MSGVAIFCNICYNILGMNTEEFRLLVKRIKKGDLSALEKLYSAYFARIYACALYEVRNRDDAYDIAMNVILRLCDYPGDPGGIRNPVGLLMTMTRNAVKDHYRRQNFYVQLGDSARLPQKEEQGTLWFDDIMQSLTEEERALFMSHAVWGKPLREIAQESGKSYITVRRAYGRIKKKLRKIYAPQN